MPFSKDIPFEVPTTKTTLLTFHDIVGVSWSRNTKIIALTIGSWESKENWANDEPFLTTTTVNYKNADDFEVLTKIINTIVNSPGSIFEGGIPDA